jgi:hypothetical protein
LLGTEKPAGGVTLIVVVPAVEGSNATFFDESPPLKLTGLPTIVPTVGFELATATLGLGEKPPRLIARRGTLTGLRWRTGESRRGFLRSGWSAGDEDGNH